MALAVCGDCFRSPPTPFDVRPQSWTQAAVDHDVEKKTEPIVFGRVYIYI